MLEELANQALQDEYFYELLLKTEKISAYNFLGIPSSLTLKPKEFYDLLRFADILSHSQNEEARNKAFKIISLIAESTYKDEAFIQFASAILSKLGNFPGINLLEKGYNPVVLPLSRDIEKEVKKDLQKVPGTDLTFTDPQYQVFQTLKKKNQLSFSGPTSLGKSFIIEAFVRYLISKGNIENIAILVPTRALINQVSLKLKQDLKDKEYKILTYPTVPELIQRRDKNYIFVFTPERLVAYLSNARNPKIDCLFVDEAHKLISDNDSRNPLYYHAVLQAERRSIKLYFASPNVPNPGIFLSLFEKDTSDIFITKESPVAQSRYFIDLVDKRMLYINERNQLEELPFLFENEDFQDVLLKLGNGRGNIVYCGSIDDTINYAVEFARTLKEKDDPRINKVVKVIEEYLHKQYYLIDCLKHGVAFHFGKLPQTIRSKIENLFREDALDYMFCTSTLLEGINMPAKNIFILSNAIGGSKFSDIDFWNLAGRAGRLNKDLSGNIICMRVDKKRNRWDNPDRDLKVVIDKEIKPKLTPIDKSRRAIFSKIEDSLKGEIFDKDNTSQTERDIWNHYANIALIHTKRGEDSVLTSNFSEKNEDGRLLLQKRSKEITVPERILSNSSSIKAKYQQKVFDNDALSQYKLPYELSHENILYFLEFLCEQYNWKEEESGGRHPLVNSEDTRLLRYYAFLMNSWMTSQPIGYMIHNSIQYHSKNSKEIMIHGKMLPFNPNDQRHINHLINKLMSDIDDVLRFKLQNYFENFYLLLQEKFGQEEAGANWGEYLEYGSSERHVIELQNIGFPRHLAKYLLDNKRDSLVFENGQLTDILEDKLFENMDKAALEYEELLEIIAGR